MKQIEKFQFPESLTIPAAYLLQEFSVNDLINLKDDNGWGFMHWAVALNNSNKINELLDSGLTFDILSNNNQLPINFIETFTNQFKKFVPFSNGGITPLHLNVFLHNESFKAQDNVKGKLFIDSIALKQENIFSSFTIHNLSLLDHNKFSITDYCFILEDIKLLELISNSDSTFSSLNKLTPTTALKIIENFHNFSFCPPPHLNTCKIIIEKLKKIVHYEHLNHSLSSKDVIKSIHKI